MLPCNRETDDTENSDAKVRFHFYKLYEHIARHANMGNCKHIFESHWYYI